MSKPRRQPGHRVRAVTQCDAGTGNKTAAAATTVDNARGCTRIGTSGNDVICALDGDDTLNAGAGNDALLGNLGSDNLNTVDGVSRNDTADGGPNTDTCTTDTGDTRLNCP